MMPQHIGKYEVRGLLGRGAMGVVYGGWDPVIERRVAIKTISLADAAADEVTHDTLERFRREAQAAGRLAHNNIVGIFDAGQTDDIAYIVMEYIEGRSLKDILEKSGALAPGEAVEIMRHVLAGLAYSHRRGVVHRDVKPANIMVTSDGTIKIADFGIARIENSTATAVGAIIGTPAYMPPEQFLGEPVDARSDIYAAGAMLFHMLTGRRMYEGNIASIMTQVLSDQPPPPPSARSPCLSPRWDALVQKATAHCRDDRFADAATFARALEETAAIASVHDQAVTDSTFVVPLPRRTTQMPPPTTPAAEPFRRRGFFWAGGAACCLAMAFFGFWLLKAPVSSVVPVPREPTTREKLSVVAIQPVNPTPAPADTQPAKPDPATLIKALADLATLPCSFISQDGVARAAMLHGAAGDDAFAIVQRLVAGSLGAVRSEVQRVPASYCDTLDALRQAAQGLPLVLSTRPGPLIFEEGELIHLKVGAPRFPAWLVVDYFSDDGSVTQIFPVERPDKHVERRDPAHIFRSADTLAFERPRLELKAGPPFGVDMIVAYASTSRNFLQGRPRPQDLSDYVVSLHRALAMAPRNDIRLAIGIVAMKFVAKR